MGPVDGTHWEKGGGVMLDRLSGVGCLSVVACKDHRRGTRTGLGGCTWVGSAQAPVRWGAGW